MKLTISLQNGFVKWGKQNFSGGIAERIPAMRRWKKKISAEEGFSGRRETGESFSPFGAYYVETGVNSCYIRKTDTEIK